MAKKKSPRPRHTIPVEDLPQVAPRDPCPCGSGKKYRVCHGRAAVVAERRFVPRPFEGLRGECDLIAMLEMVPAATATLTLAEEYRQRADGRTVTAATVLPGAVSAIVRVDGEVLLGLQTPSGSGDASRDIADVIIRALDAEPGSQLTTSGLAGPGPRLQDVLDTDEPFQVRMHADFTFWLEGSEDVPPEVKVALEKANAAVVPTVRLTGLDAAYWVRIGSKEHLRWVLPHDEDALLDGFARLHAAGEDTLGPDTRFIGSFRAHGLLVPVWDLAPGTEAEDVAEPAAQYQARLQDALAVTGPLTAAERHARAGLLNRQLTLR